MRAKTLDDDWTDTIQVALIRHKPTGNYLPEAYGKDKRGGSHVEPVPPHETGKQRPRVFKSERAAKIFLTGWLAGKVKSWYDTDDGECYTRVEPVESRKAEEMEIVSYTIDLYTR